MLPSLSKEDLRDLFPGPEHFLRRRAIWRMTHGENQGEESDQLQPGTSGTCELASSNYPTTSTPLSTPSSSPTSLPPSNLGYQHVTSRTLQLVSPQYVVYTDTELEQSRTFLPVFLWQIMDELQRILNQGNSHFIPELKNRWGTFCEKAQFYGVFKKVMRPPLSNKVKQTIAMIKALLDMFPSPIAPPKKLGHASEGMLHILESAEDPNSFLQARPLLSPVVIVCETNCILAIGKVAVLIFPKEDIADSAMYIMACYYTFHLTYPKCIATLLSILQTEVLMDAIHESDMTSSYKKAIADWKRFITE
ncbi:hypothetical protein N1851_008485 [Merluccius polli]|uniref:Uncharacterized protein n=1 Tax=Merluccius polli TaxID=89951 RepID=A0AA47N101_MERPO|nr:hypothetical protein N1851_008485 [Merluccius polli]